MVFDQDNGVLEFKLTQLSARLRALARVAIAYSGGVDSTFLLAAAARALGSDNVLAVTISSELTPASEIALACRMAAQLGVEHHVLSFQALAIPEIQANTPDRCYHCKREVLHRIGALATQHGFSWVLHGANQDDRADYRPGARAAAELGALAPLDEVGLDKSEIRALSRQFGLLTWNLPSRACLASRMPYGMPLSNEALQRIEAAEDYLRTHLHLSACRVRDHHPVARIEIPDHDWPRLLDEQSRTGLLAEFLRLGYTYVALDLAGLRSGSMNDVLRAE